MHVREGVNADAYGGYEVSKRSILGICAWSKKVDERAFEVVYVRYLAPINTYNCLHMLQIPSLSTLSTASLYTS